MIRSIVLHDLSATRIAAIGRWFWRNHSPETCQQKGLFRFLGIGTAALNSGLDGTWPSRCMPPTESFSASRVGVIERWFENFDHRRNAVIDNLPTDTKSP